MKKIFKTKKYLFYIFLALLPLNIRHVFNYEQVGILEGFREHVSWSFYAFDIFFLLVIFAHLVELLRSMLRNNSLVDRIKERLSSCCGFSSKEKIKKTLAFIPKKPFLALFVVLALSIFFSLDAKIGLYNGARIAGAILLFYIAKDIFAASPKAKKRSVTIIFLAGLLQSTIALMQFVLQRSIGIKILGESVIAPDILGVSKFEFAGEKLIRAYGTFPHPNILGAFLLLSFAAGAWLFFHKEKIQKTIGNIGLVVGNVMIILGIFLSYSRSILLALAIFVFLLLFIYKDYIIGLYKKYCRKLRINSSLQGAVGILIVFSALLVAYNLMAPRLCITNCPGDNSFVLRLVYNKASFAAINEKPLLGVGPGCFVPFLDSNPFFGLNQWEKHPVHNIYLLVASEIGLIGLAAFLFVIASQISSKKLFKNKLLTNPFVVVFILYLGLGLIDHYFWTTPQEQMIFWLSLAFFASSGRISK